MNYPGQAPFANFPSLAYNPSTSNTVVLVVQQQQVVAPSNSLPTSYWTRPINAQNYAWASISSNWVMSAWNETGSSFFPGGRAFDDGSAYQGEGTSPNSAHILWTAPLTFGGLAGGNFGSATFYQGASYEQFFTPPVIIGGILYYNGIAAEEPTANNIIAINMTDGHTLFTIPNTSLSFGQIYNYVSPNQAGTYAYLWSAA